MIRRWSSARVSIHVIMYIWYTIIALLLFNRRCCCYSGHCLEFLEKRDNVVLGPFCKTTCTCGALIQARLHVHRATTSATVVFIELAYHDRNKSQWNLLLRVDQLLLGWALQALNYITEVFFSEESERTEWNLEAGFLKPPVEHSFSLVWMVRKQSLRIQFISCLIEYCKQTNLIDCRWNCAFQFLFKTSII